MSVWLGIDRESMDIIHARPMIKPKGRNALLSMVSLHTTTQNLNQLLITTETVISIINTSLMLSPRFALITT